MDDEYWLADDLATALRDAGAEVLGPVGDVERALAMIGREERIDGALLDVNLGGASVLPVADMLAARGVPFVFTTGYDASTLSVRYGDVARCEKPVDMRRVKRAIGLALRAGRHGAAILPPDRDLP